MTKSANFGDFYGWRFLAQNFAQLANFDQAELGTLNSRFGSQKTALFLQHKSSEAQKKTFFGEVIEKLSN